MKYRGLTSEFESDPPMRTTVTTRSTDAVETRPCYCEEELIALVSWPRESQDDSYILFWCEHCGRVMRENKDGSRLWLKPDRNCSVYLGAPEYVGTFPKDGRR